MNIVATAQDRREYQRYLLILLMIIMTFNYVDRFALGVVLQNVKADLALTDTQLGLLTGIAFAFFYAVMGIPIARWADRGNRVAIISLTAVVWSIAVIFSGIAASFLQLLAIRIVVAIGEAGCVPPAHSLIAENFTRTERPRAVSRYMLGVPLALTFGYFSAGWLNEAFGWRRMFMIIGIPGLALALLAHATLIEPRNKNRALGNVQLPLEVSPRFSQVCSVLWSIVAFRHLLFCFSVWFFFGYGLQQWQPAFFIRSHGLQTGVLGTWLALVYGVGGIIGVFLGGELATRYAARNERLQLNACAVAFVFFALLNAYAYLTSSYRLAFAALSIAALGNVVQGPILATMQTLVPAHMRAMSIAIVYLCANLIGMGLGPLVAGVLSDTLRSTFGQDSLRYALVLLCPGYFWAAWHLWRAGRTVIDDLQTAQALDATPKRTQPHLSFSEQ